MDFYSLEAYHFLSLFQDNRHSRDRFVLFLPLWCFDSAVRGVLLANEYSLDVLGQALIFGKNY